MEEIIQAFGLDIKLFLAQLINFAILFIVLAKFLYPKLLKMMNERTDKIENSLKLAEKIEKDHEESMKKQEEILKQAKEEAKVIIAETTKIAAKEKTSIKEQAEVEAKRIIEEAKKEIEKEKVAMITEVKKEVSDIAVLVASKIMAKSITKEDQDKFKDEILEVVGEK